MRENSPKELNRQILEKWLLALGWGQAGWSRLEGEAEASARGSAAKPVVSLLILCTGTQSGVPAKIRQYSSRTNPLFWVFG